MQPSMFNQEIINYINAHDHDFDTGVLIFERYSRNRSVLHYLQRKRNMDKLLYELNKMSKIPHLKVMNPHVKVNIAAAEKTDIETTLPLQKTTTVETTELPAQRKNVLRESLSADHQLLFDEISEKYKLQRVFHEKMKLATTVDERAACRASLVELDDAIAAGWDVIDGRNTPPSTQVEIPVSESELLHREVNNARVKITRLLKAYKPEKFEAVQQQVEILIKHNASVSATTRSKLIKLNVIQANSNLLGK